jgi:uncharacterized protein (DUF2126 family)
VRPELERELLEHDAAVARSGLELWLGTEPTFTDARSIEPRWLTEPEGGDKEARARTLLAALAPRLGGTARLFKVTGRHYDGEPRPRFCLGVLFERSGRPAPLLPDDLLGLEGAPRPAPAVGPGQAWLTVTPDPGVVEVNSAPAPDLATFARWSEAIYAAAGEAGLSPERFRFNGDATDSGGGGQLTLGGPSPERSPFFLRPQLLPRLVRYLNRHPALSYAFAPDCVGSASQGPRPDEGARERFEELPVALEWLTRRGDRTTPDELWGALAPLLVDLSGNAHRAEVNLEKLWNPFLPGRGRLGVVELRALRMPPSPAGLVAVAALFRALAARLAGAPYDEPLVDWGPRLHGQLGLPWYLRRDLEAVLADLAGHGLGLGPLLSAVLLAGPEPLAQLTLPDATLTLTPARSFWPLVGDVASQERAGARAVDPSAVRLQLVVSSPQGARTDAISTSGWRIPLAPLSGEREALGSVTWRTFVPHPGLHPGLPPSDPLVLEWAHARRGARIALHGWNPAGGAYDGLPADGAEARRRREARVVVTLLPYAPDVRGGAGGTFGLDLRQPTAPPLALPPPEPLQ